MALCNNIMQQELLMPMVAAKYIHLNHEFRALVDYQ
jgi:hypothetical protein